MTTETQIYEVLVAEEKAAAVNAAIIEKLNEAKAAGNIVSASYTRKLIKRASI